LQTPSRRVLAGLVTLGAAAICLGTSVAVASAASNPAIPTVHLHLFAAAPQGASKPDDITKLGDDIFVAYQNNAGADGTPAGSFSTVVGFDVKTAKAVKTYTIPGRVDGMAADVKHHRIFASVNEDLNSSLVVITPGEDEHAVVHYTYSPDPAETGSDGINGGTDSISIATDGSVYVSHSNPDLSLPAPNNTAAVYRINLDGDQANLTRVFGVNDNAKVINPAAGAPTTAALGLTDPDSNRFLPGPAGGTLVQVSQADSKIVFASDLHAVHPDLTQLNLTNAAIPTSGDATTTPQIDDIEKVTGNGTLFVVDQKAGDIYTIDTAGIAAGTLFVSQPAPSSGDLPNDPALGVLNPTTGVVTHVASLMSAKGLLFVPAAQNATDKG
jgi:hypothetical protein